MDARMEQLRKALTGTLIHLSFRSDKSDPT